MQIFRRRISATPRIISVGNLKGGTGKSTVAINLASAFADSGLSTVVIDTDPQKSATQWARGGKLPTAVADFPLRDLLGTGEWLEELEVLRDRYSRLVIDLPAVLSPAMAAAFLVSDMILIPSSTSVLDIEATRRTLQRVNATRKERPKSPPHVLIVPTLVRRGWFDDGGVSSELPALGEKLAPPIRYDRAFSTAYRERSWIGAHAPRSAAHRDVLALLDAVATTLHGRPGAPAPSAGPGGRTLALA